MALWKQITYIHQNIGINVLHNAISLRVLCTHSLLQRLVGSVPVYCDWAGYSAVLLRIPSVAAHILLWSSAFFFWWSWPWWRAKTVCTWVRFGCTHGYLGQLDDTRKINSRSKQVQHQEQVPSQERIGSPAIPWCATSPSFPAASTAGCLGGPLLRWICVRYDSFVLVPTNQEKSDT